MKSMKWFSLAALCVGGAIMVFSACQKSSSAGSSLPANQQKFNMYLTDGPVQFQAVNIDIQSIAVLVESDSCVAAGVWGQNGQGDDDRDGDDDDHNKMDTACFHWDSLHITPGVYNILNFKNGLDTLFSSTNIPKGKIIKIRFTLGSNNTIVADSTTFDLDLAWGHTFTIDVNDCEQIDENTLGLWVDFDAAHSIIEVEHQHFVLKPVIRLFTRSNSGSLEGALLPGAADPFVSVISGTDTLIALPGEEGHWKIRGIKTSTVDVTFRHTAGSYHDTTINNIAITPGTTVNLGTVYLH